jgi:hypothetical protein
MSSIIVNNQSATGTQNVSFSKSVSYYANYFDGTNYIPITNIRFSAQNLPYGLSIDSSLGIISGTPSSAGIYGVIVNIVFNLSSDTSATPTNYTDSQILHITINPSPTPTPTPTPTVTQILTNPPVPSTSYNAPPITTQNLVNIQANPTGYLYSWGEGLSLSNYIPNILTSQIVSGISVGTDVNFAIVPDKSSLYPTPLPTQSAYTGNLSPLNKTNNFKFILYNPWKDPCINQFSIISTSSGVSGQLVNNIYVSTAGGDSGVYQNANIVSVNFNNQYSQYDNFYTGSLLSKTNYQQNGSYLSIRDKNNINYLTGNSFGTANSFSGNIKINGGNTGKFYIDYSSNPFSPTYQNGVYRQSLNINNTNILYDNINQVNSDSVAWVSYDFSNSQSFPYNSTNVFSYAVEIVGKISSNSILLPSSGSDVYSGYKSTLLPSINTGMSSIFSEYKNFCLSFINCDQATVKPDDLEICWTGATSGQDYQNFISGLKSLFLSQTFVPGYDNIPSTFIVTSGTLKSGLFSYQTGSIVYNNFQSGDSITFNSYGYDYSGLYSGYHLGNVPTYPNYSITFNYGVDFYDINSLVSALNNKLRDTSYNLWYPYVELSGTSMGIYITGGLVQFSINQDTSLSGTTNYNNIINFASLRNNSYPYSFNLNLTSREDNIQNYNSNSYTGMSYLIPDSIQLQGWDPIASDWVILDSQDGISSQILNLKPTFAPSPLDSSYIYQNNNIHVSSIPINQDSQNGLVSITSGVTIQEPPVTGFFVPVYSFRQNIVQDNGPYCGTSQFSRNVSVTVPSGWPSGALSGCKLPSGFDPCLTYAQQLGIPLVSQLGDEGCGDGMYPVTYTFSDNTICYSCTGNTGVANQKPQSQFKLWKYRTGWNLNTTGNYLTCLTSGDSYSPFAINFSQYRIVLSNLNGLASTPDNYRVKQIPEIYVTNINLFGAQKTGASVHKIENISPILSKYSVQVGATVPIKLNNYPYQYSIKSQSQSGLYRAFSDPIIYTPTGNELNVSFIHSSGKFVGNVSGLVTNTFTGIGTISSTLDNYFFYDTATSTTSFEKIYSAYVTGGGYLSGNETIIKQSVINKQLLAGGVFGATYTTLSAPGIVYGIVNNASCLLTGVTGNYYLSTLITGISNSGYYNYNQFVTGSPTYSGNSYPYYIIPTGFINSTASIFINTTGLNQFDTVSINNQIVSYSQDTVNYIAPQYFGSASGLVSIINSNPNNFNCYAVLDSGNQNNINLYSLVSGASGNSILISTNNTSNIILTSNSLTGGQNIYAPLNTILSTFSGIAQGRIAATGNYSVQSNPGVLTGTLNVFYGTRYFTDVWNLSTGTSNLYTRFGTGNILNNKSRYSGNFNLKGSIYDSNFQLLVGYNSLNYQYINNNPDIAQVRVIGNNFYGPNTGITFLISGY